MRRVQILDPYKVKSINLLASFPDAKIELRDIVVNDSSELGLRIATIWALRGTYCGVPTYGPITRTPANILGVFAFRAPRRPRAARIPHLRRGRRHGSNHPWTGDGVPQLSRNGARSMALAPVSTHWAIASPRPGECLNPWPEQAETAATQSWPGSRSTMNRESGVTV